MNIPKRDVVSFVLKETLRGRTARSQHELSVMLRKRLARGNPGYSISGPRARKLALETAGIKVRIETRKGRLPKRCPACGHAIRKSYSKNLKGRKLLVRISCSRCPYRGSGGSWIPKRYEFSAK